MSRYVIYEDQRFLDMPVLINLFHSSSPVIPIYMRTYEKLRNYELRNYRFI